MEISISGGGVKTGIMKMKRNERNIKKNFKKIPIVFYLSHFDDCPQDEGDEASRESHVVLPAAAVLLLLLGKEIVLLDLNDSNFSLARVGPQLRDDPLVFACEEVREDQETAEEDAQYQYLPKIIK